jgi:hypothetical protein
MPKDGQKMVREADLIWMAPPAKGIRVPDAVQRETLLRRAGTYRTAWAPDQQRTAIARLRRA